MKITYIEGPERVRIGNEQFTLGVTTEVTDEALIDKLLQHPSLKFEKAKKTADKPDPQT